MIDTKELRQLAQDATPGPWFSDARGNIWRRPLSDLYENGGSVAGDKPIAFVFVGWRGEGVTGYPVENNARLIAAANPATISELLDRLEAAEKDIALKERVIDALGSELNAVAKEHDALRAKIAEMEKQEPGAWTYEDMLGRKCVGFDKPLHRPNTHEPLYALPGAQNAPSVQRDDIMRMAREAGFRVGHIELYNIDPIPFVAPVLATDCLPELERFAALVAAAAEAKS